MALLRVTGSHGIFCCVGKCHNSYLFPLLPHPPYLCNDLGFLVDMACARSLRLKTCAELLHWIFTECADLIPAGKGITRSWASESQLGLDSK